ncbi:unnamed protein product [Soboliphyme baturini]|uniref:Ku domain-containing protein n=1 Tax=Soboliphyme baturini TaxID=241478 RepID=A0A183IHF2_9BILA|nr:unnamed protein product [Soboliphyme baturini]
MDVGPSMREIPPGRSSALSLCQQCVSWIVQRRIFTESKDEIAVVLFGTIETENPLASNTETEYQHISLVRNLLMADWNLVKYIDEGIPSECQEANLADALMVAMHVLVSGTRGRSFAQKSIVLFTDFGTVLNDDQYQTIIQDIKELQLEIVLIDCIQLSGMPVQVENFTVFERDRCEEDNVKLRRQHTAADICKKLVSAADGTCCSIRYGYHYHYCHHFSIVYNLGQQFLIIKSISIQETEGKQIKPHYYSGDGSYLVFANSSNKAGCAAFSAFAHAMQQTGKVAIVRYCYSVRSSPRIGVLIPLIKRGYTSFVYLSLPFAEEIATFALPSLIQNDRIKPSDEQLDAVDRLIDALDLTNVSPEGEKELYRSKDILNPSIQFLFRVRA